MTTTYDEWKKSRDFYNITNSLLETLEKAANGAIGEGDYLDGANKLNFLYNALKNNAVYVEHRERAQRPEPRQRQIIHHAEEDMLNCVRCSRPIYCPKKHNSQDRYMCNMNKHNKTLVCKETLIQKEMAVVYMRTDTTGMELKMRNFLDKMKEPIGDTDNTYAKMMSAYCRSLKKEYFDA
tara:strand:- start:557 stop:1096 length:540 start_codon:yes stop_codon:yes gene_type:complete